MEIKFYKFYCSCYYKVAGNSKWMIKTLLFIIIRFSQQQRIFFVFVRLDFFYYSLFYCDHCNIFKIYLRNIFSGSITNTWNMYTNTKTCIFLKWFKIYYITTFYFPFMLFYKLLNTSGIKVKMIKAYLL